MQLGMKMANLAREEWQPQRCIVLLLASAALQLEVPSLGVVYVARDWCINIYELRHRT